MQELAQYAVSPTALWILLAVIFGAWLVVSWVLSYHWRSYAKGSAVIARVMWIYFGVSLVVFIIQAFLILSL